MIENKLVKLLEDAGIKSEITHFELTPEDKRRQKEIWNYIWGIEKAHKKASKSSDKIIFKEYSTNTYSPFPNN